MTDEIENNWWQVKAHFLNGEVLEYAIYNMKDELIAQFPKSQQDLAIEVMQRHNEAMVEVDND